jgi:hypothetical protein
MLRTTMVATSVQVNRYRRRTQFALCMVPSSLRLLLLRRRIHIAHASSQRTQKDILEGKVSKLHPCGELIPLRETGAPDTGMFISNCILLCECFPAAQEQFHVTDCLITAVTSIAHFDARELCGTTKKIGFTAWQQESWLCKHTFFLSSSVRP